MLQHSILRYRTHTDTHTHTNIERENRGAYNEKERWID